MDDNTEQTGVLELVQAARAAYAAATDALLRAEAAAAAAGVALDSPDDTAIDTLTVRQINVVEDDGTLRMVIANSRLSGTETWRGKIRRRDDRRTTAGIMFANDEGTECGGLIFNGSSDENGPRQLQVMSFDDYEQNESMSFAEYQTSPYVTKFLTFTDQPSWSLTDYKDEAEGLTGDALRAVQDKYWTDCDGDGFERLRLFEHADGAAGLTLSDGRGRPRLRFVVPADGSPTAEVLATDGSSQSLIPPAASDQPAEGSKASTSL